jgi:hypothetical protein
VKTSKLLLLVPVVLILSLCCTCASADESNNNDGGYNFTAVDENVTYQESLDFMYAVPMRAGDNLDVNISMSNNCSFICVDQEGMEKYIQLMAQNATPKEMADVLYNHTVSNCSLFNSSSYQMQLTSTNDTYFCLVILPTNADSVPEGHITAIRHSLSEENIYPGFDGNIMLLAYYKMLSEENQQSQDYSSSGDTAWAPNMNTTESSYVDGLYKDNNDGFGDWGPITGSNLYQYDNISPDTDVSGYGSITGPNVSQVRSTTLSDYPEYQSVLISQINQNNISQRILEQKEWENQLQIESPIDGTGYLHSSDDND